MNIRANILKINNDDASYTRFAINALSVVDYLLNRVIEMSNVIPLNKKLFGLCMKFAENIMFYNKI